MTISKNKAYILKCKAYAKFLKDDHDFDWTYILSLLRYKLQRTRKCIAKGWTTDRAKYAAEIREVEDLLQRVLEHDYRKEVFAAFEKKYGKPKMKVIAKTKHTSQLEFIYRNGKPATKAMNREHMKLFAKSEANRKADLKKAFDLILEKIEGWWD